MAKNLCSSDSGLYQGTVLLSNPCLWLAEDTELCCIDNVQLNVTTETVVDQKIWAAKCAVRRIHNATTDLSFDTVGNISADVASLIFQNATVTKYDAGTPVTETITLVEGAWCSDDLDVVSYRIPFGNADGTVPVVVVTGSVDGVLTDGTDYVVTQNEICVAFGAVHNENFLTLEAHGGFANNLTTDDQDLTITVTYTPATVTGIEFSDGNFASKPLDVTLIGVNKSDNTDVKIWRFKAYFLYSWPLFTWDNGEGELDANNISLEIVEDSVIKGINIQSSSACYDTCS